MTVNGFCSSGQQGEGSNEISTPPAKQPAWVCLCRDSSEDATATVNSTRASTNAWYCQLNDCLQWPLSSLVNPGSSILLSPWELNSLQGFTDRAIADVPCPPLQEIKLLLDLPELFFQARHFPIITCQPGDSR